MVLIWASSKNKFDSIMIPITTITQSYGNKNTVDFTNTLKIVEQNRESRNETIHLKFFMMSQI